MKSAAPSLGRWAIAGALACTACSTTHTLHVSANTSSPAPQQRSGCSIGVGSFTDEEGVDHALDLRDHLRRRGPCARVIVVSSEHADVDVVVTGRVRATLTPDLQPAGVTVSNLGLGFGLGSVIVGSVLLGVAKEPRRDTMGFVNPSDRASYNTMRDAGTGLLVGGIVLATLAAGGLVIDSTVTREMKLDARVDAEVKLSRDGRAFDEMKLHDHVVVRGRHPRGRPEGRDSYAAFGPLVRETMEHIFEHIAARLGEAVSQPTKAKGADDGTPNRLPER